MTLAIGHAQESVAVLDALREVRAPFSPDDAVAEFATLLKAYGIAKVRGDRYAAEWVTEAFKKSGIEYRPADLSKSEIYRDFLPRLNSREVELLDSPRLVAQLCGLERRTARGGRDSIDHAPGAHDDVANAAAGVLVYLTSARHQPYTGPYFGTYVNGNIEMGDGAGTGYAAHPPEYWAAQGIFHPQDRQKWIDAGVWTPKQEQK